MMGRDPPSYPYLPGVNDTTRDVIAVRLQINYLSCADIRAVQWVLTALRDCTNNVTERVFRCL